MVGDCDHYFSPYMLGVAQACGALGIWHDQISIRNSVDQISDRILDVRPDLLWTHMMLWAPSGSPRVEALLDLCAAARARGAYVLLHDGDYKERTRYPKDVSSAVDLALCNHRHDRSAWGVPTVWWPYAAFPQSRLAEPVEELRCDVAFAGQLGDGIYAERTRMILELRRRGIDVRVFGEGGNTLLRTPEIAASARCVLGFGRPQIPGWVDTRVAQYAGAGAVLVHDDVAGMLTAGHFIPYDSGDVDSLEGAVRLALAMSDDDRLQMRCRAFDEAQTCNSWVSRAEQVLGHREQGR